MRFGFNSVCLSDTAATMKRTSAKKETKSERRKRQRACYKLELQDQAEVLVAEAPPAAETIVVPAICDVAAESSGSASESESSSSSSSTPAAATGGRAA